MPGTEHAEKDKDKDKGKESGHESASHDAHSSSGGPAQPGKDPVKVAAARARRPPATLEDVLSMSYAEVLAFPLKYVAGKMPPENGAEVGAPTDGGRYNELQAILRGPLQSNWFFAKDVLLKGKGGKARDAEGREVAPDPEAMRNLMWRLIGAREYAFNKTLADVRNTEGMARFPSDSKAEVLSWSYSGSESATSDVDVNLKGKFNGQAVGAFNSRFRSEWGIESGIGYDVNVYALDFMHGFSKKVEEKDGKKTLEISPAVEKGVAIKDGKRKEMDVADQETWSIVHVLRYMKDGVRGSEWADYKRSALEGAGDKRGPLTARLRLAEDRFTSYEAQIANMMSHIDEESAKAVKGLEHVAAAAGGREKEVGDGHDQHKALEMRAANRLYEQKVAMVIASREDLDKQLAAHPRNEEAIERTLLILRAHMSDALMYANEAYLTDGAVNHVVVGMQIGNGIAKKEGAADVKVQLGDEQFLHSFNEQFGDALKECNHYEANFGAACFKGGKYIDRMVKAAKQLHGAETDPNLEGLRLLGEKSVEVKGAALDKPDTDASVRPAAKEGPTAEASCASEATRVLSVTTTAGLRAKLLATGANVPTLFRKAKSPGGSSGGAERREEPTASHEAPKSTGPGEQAQTLKKVAAVEIASVQETVAKMDPATIEAPARTLKGQS